MQHHNRRVETNGPAGSSARLLGAALLLLSAGGAMSHSAVPLPQGSLHGWSSTRPLALRLADDRQFRPCPANQGADSRLQLRCGQSPGPPPAGDSIVEIAAATSRSADARGAIVRKLIGGNAAGALEELSRLPEPEASHDLAVARAVAGLEAEDWPLVLEAVDFFARRAEAGDEVARFNLAILGEVLGLWRLAEVQWQISLQASPNLQASPGPGWAEEVGERRA